jgi:hypothetical protein
LKRVAFPRKRDRAFAEAATIVARDLLGFPSDRNWAMLLSPGYPADRPLGPVKNPKRRLVRDDRR